MLLGRRSWDLLLLREGIELKGVVLKVRMVNQLVKLLLWGLSIWGWNLE